MTKETQKPQLNVPDVSGSAFNYVHKCLKCEFEGNIANSMEDWETGEYFQYWSQKDIIECPHCGNMQHYR